jgi:hypothetical protein
LAAIRIQGAFAVRKNALLLLFSSLLCSGASAPKSKVAPDFASVDPNTQVNVIVQWKNTPDDVRNEKVRDRGGKLRSLHQSIKAASYSMPASMVNDLANDPDVARIVPDRRITSKLDYSTTAVNAVAAWARNLDGKGVGVAVIDSGMLQNGDLTKGNTVVYNEDFTGEFKQGRTSRIRTTLPICLDTGNTWPASSRAAEKVHRVRIVRAR